MSYNSLTYFNLDLNTLTPRDKFIMRAFVDQVYLTNLYQATDYAKQLSSQGQTYCYKYVPQEPGLYPKIYNEREINALTFISSWVENPYTYDFSKPIKVGFFTYDIDEVDRAFIIVIKGRQFYQSLFAALEMAKEFRGNGRYYCYNMITPKWFPEDKQYASIIPGQFLILLSYNQDYILKEPLNNLIEKLNS